MKSGLRSWSDAGLAFGENAGVSLVGTEVEKLEEYLKVLGYRNRLRLLTILREPRTLDEIHLTPNASQAGDNPRRTISRQAVQNHLDRLLEVGLVRVGKTDRKGRRGLHEYVLDHARLYGIVEELSKLCISEISADVDPFATEGLPATDHEGGAEGEGPHVVLVKGVSLGRRFGLSRKELEGGRGWVIGRADHAQICLGYDPWVSHENAEIIPTGNAFKLLDLRTAKNGTSLNWQRLPIGGEAVLKHGDVVGVGRSLLLFREP